MAKAAVENLLKNREEFVKILENDLAKNRNLTAQIEKAVENLHSTRDHVQVLSEKVQHAAMIPLGKRCYVPGNIVHTGEYYVDHPAHPNSYTLLQTKDETLAHLERRIQAESKTLEQCRNIELQLKERLELLKSKDRPVQIQSDKGVALQVGEFYEIIEYED